ncbi:MAG TPA: PilZ domain-containing protein [Bryobacteraceae bacterium]|nr:PilZ domain-containing protein [Bryobacteraceae bacterium]
MNPFEAQLVSEAEQIFARERRASRRFDMPLRLRWKVLRRGRVLEAGAGTTVDMSSSGILFQTDTKLPLDGTVELSIAWPVLLHDNLPMQLMVCGRIVRASRDGIAIAINQYEFRTAGAAAPPQLHCV